MVTVGRPSFSVEEAGEIAASRYGVEAVVRSLSGYSDQNFHLARASGEQFVLKIAHASERRDSLDLQNRAMSRVSDASIGVETPQVCPTSAGGDSTSVEGSSGARHMVRLLTWVEGTAWSAAPPAPASRLRDLGRLAGKMDIELEGLPDASTSRFSEWDLKELSGIEKHIGALANRERREMVQRVLHGFEAAVAPRLTSFRQGVIHGDVNNDNVLVGADGAIVGLIDFGDVVYTAIVFEVAIAATYAMLDRNHPAAVGAEVLVGFDSVRPLQAEEREVVFDLICGRLAMSATFAAHFSCLDPANPAITANESRAWSTLEKLLDRESDMRRELIRPFA